jgi:O-antigen/teichoic acid export membrane protein
MTALGSEQLEGAETGNEQPPPRGRSGARSGALLGVASLTATAANYAFLLAAARVLGTADYGDLAALLGFLTVVLLPTSALQLAVSREISRRLATGDAEGARAFAYASVRLAVIATIPLVVVALVLAVPVGALLRIDSTLAALLAALGLAGALAFPVALGVLQGQQRFGAVAALYLLPSVLRLALFLPLAWVGFRLGGAVYATVAAGIAASAAALGLLLEPLRQGARLARPALHRFLRYLAPVVVGLLGIAVLTTVDLLVVKVRFGDDSAGQYAAASAFARVAFFIPATILAVLFPRTAARQARGEKTEDILGRSLLVTAGFCGALILFYWMAGRGLVHSTFGAEFAEGGELLVPFTLSVAVYALANVLVGFHLSRGETRYAWIVAGAVGVQIALLAIVPGGVDGVIWANVGVGMALLAAHELFVGSSVPALRVGSARLAERVAISRRVLVEGALVVVGTAAFVAWLTWPIVPELASTAVGTHGSDSSGTISWLWRTAQEGYHLFGTTTHRLEGAPIGWEEANGLNLQWLVPYYPAYLLAQGVGEMTAYNLILLGGYVLSGVTMYLLTRYLGCAPLVSAWAALAYVVFPAHAARIEHASLTHFEVLVLVVLAVAAAAERPTALRFLLVGAATLGAWLTSGYFGAMAAVSACAFALAAAPTLRTRRLRLVAGTAAAAAASTVVLALSTTAPGVNTAAELGREVTDLSYFGLRLTELVVPSAGNRLVGDWAASFHDGRLHGSNFSETSNYVGLLTLALAAAWLVVAWRRRSTLRPRLRAATAGLTAVVLTALLFALPSPLTVFGASFTWTPARVLWELVPALRVSSRWTIMLMTALVPLAALGLDAAVRAVQARRRRTSRLATHGLPLVIVGCAVVVSFLELSVPPVDETFSTRPVPPEYAAVERMPSGILAEYPLRRSDIYSFWQREHGRPLLNGAPAGSQADEVRRTLVDPGEPGAAERLALLGVTAIVTRANALDFASEDAPDVPNARWGDGYALVSRYGDGTSVWRVTASPAPAFTTYPSEAFVEPVVHPDGFVGHPLTGKTGWLELSSPTSRTVRLRFDVQPTAEKDFTLHLSGIEGATSVPVADRTSVSVDVRVPAGRSRIELRAEPDPDPGIYPIELTVPSVEPASGRPVVTAAPIEGRAD